MYRNRWTRCITYIPGSSLGRGSLQLWYQRRRFRPVGSKDLTCEYWMVNTRTDAELAATVQNALQTLLPQIRAEIREEFCTGSGPSSSGGNPPPFFPRVEHEHLKREYHSIRQTNTETSTEFMQRFLRLVGFLEAAAGTTEEQAKNFQWDLRKSTLNHLMCIPFT
nr:zinc finger, CCHC-type, retrotransposon Gag domain protein [Tanacetum cinerariifolium]